MNKKLAVISLQLVFAGTLFAAEPAKKGAAPAPFAPAAGEVKKEETKLVKKKATKGRQVKKKGEEKHEVAPSAPEKK